MTPEEYKAKYGDAIVRGVDRSITDEVQKDGFTCRRDAIKVDGDQVIPLQNLIAQNLTPMPRWEAEGDPDFKQVIPYVILEHQPTGRIFMTARLGGDERLLGQNSIGLGGHIDGDESIMDCLYRELKEEVALDRDDIADITFCGFLYSDANEVDSVHVGMVYRVFCTREDLACQEKDKLTGGWFTPKELREARNSGHMESWSVMVYDALLHEDDEADEEEG